MWVSTVRSVSQRRRATAFWHRGASYCLEMAAAWPADDENPRRHVDWADRLWEATRPWAVGAEVNHLADEGPEGVRRAYGGNYYRLARLKRIWDPQNVFRLNQNVPPAAARGAGASHRHGRPPAGPWPVGPSPGRTTG
ncbi:BBE domain-containing protein [Sphaerisporangium sp. NPDC051011]|uniref:BBE domain-containing protein n=1 Tax=Sphaerisporangium sp. NPDC051011 TaxID=3155792 RepID=UPI0034025527